MSAIRLHRSDQVLHVIAKTDEAIRVVGMLDKTDTLSLYKVPGGWSVSAQCNGLRMKWAKTQGEARKYMAYMLEHGADALADIPADRKKDIPPTVYVLLRVLHFKAEKASK